MWTARGRADGFKWCFLSSSSPPPSPRPVLSGSRVVRARSSVSQRRRPGLPSQGGCPELRGLGWNAEESNRFRHLQDRDIGAHPTDVSGLSRTDIGTGHRAVPGSGIYRSAMGPRVWSGDQRGPLLRCYEGPETCALAQGPFLSSLRTSWRRLGLAARGSSKPQTPLPSVQFCLDHGET